MQISVKHLFTGKHFCHSIEDKDKFFPQFGTSGFVLTGSKIRFGQRNIAKQECSTKTGSMHGVTQGRHGQWVGAMAPNIFKIVRYSGDLSSVGNFRTFAVGKDKCFEF